LKKTYSMKHRFILTLSIATLTFTIFCISCKKSNNSGNSQAAGYPNAIEGSWADSLFIDATTPGNIDTLDVHLDYPDSIQFLTNNNLVGVYYTKGFNTVTEQEQWYPSIDSATYRFLNDTTFVGANLTPQILSFSSDTFYIRGLTATQLKLYSPNTGGTGGYYYIYTKY
jgi:hypothetical protein